MLLTAQAWQLVKALDHAWFMSDTASRSVRVRRIGSRAYGRWVRRIAAERHMTIEDVRALILQLRP